MLAIILTVVTLGLTSFVAAFLNHSLKINIQGFSIAYVFPIGAALVGGLAASGLFVGTKLAKQPLRTWLVPVAMVVGLVAFFTSSYGDYYYSIKDLKQGIETKYGKLTDQQWKEFDKKLNEEFSYFDYLKHLHNESSVTFTSRSNRKGLKFEGGFVSAASFWLSVAGGAIGGWFVSSWAIGERTKDKTAKMYRDLKYAASVAPELYDDLIKKMADEKDPGQAVAKILAEHKHDKMFKGKPRTAIKVLKTRTTGVGQVLVELHDMVNNNDKLVAKVEKELTAEQMTPVQAAINQLQPKEKF